MSAGSKGVCRLFLESWSQASQVCRYCVRLPENAVLCCRTRTACADTLRDLLEAGGVAALQGARSRPLVTLAKVRWYRKAKFSNATSSASCALWFVSFRLNAAQCVLLRACLPPAAVNLQRVTALHLY